MTVPVLTYSELKGILEDNGFEIEDPQAQDFFSELNRIIVKKDDYAFPLQYKNKYFYNQVVPLLKQLDIPVPEDHLTCYNQQLEMEARKRQEKLEKEKTKDEGESEN